MASFGLKGMTISWVPLIKCGYVGNHLIYFPQVIVYNKLLVINIVFSVILNFTPTQAFLIW